MKLVIRNRWDRSIILHAKDHLDLKGVNLSEADLSHANLRRADLTGANLMNANLCSCDLRGATLVGANLRCADLNRCDLLGSRLMHANLGGAGLYRSNLTGAQLYHTNLAEADLRYANLKDVIGMATAWLYNSNLKGAKNIPSHVADQLMVCPLTGAFEAWKKCTGGVIVKLLIPEKARRSCATGRKCRAEYVKTLQIFGQSANKPAVSQHDPKVTYRVGKITRCDKWGTDRWEECAGGIHFFMTRAEAETY